MPKVIIIMLWIDKYSPKVLSDLECHPNINRSLKCIADAGIGVHLLFHGPPSSGKHIRIYALLKEYYGENALQFETITSTFKASNKKFVEITYKKSQYVIEINPSLAGHHDRIVVQQIIKEVATTNNLRNSIDENAFKPHVIYLRKSHMLTKEAQSSLRRTMEKSAKNCKIIMSVNNLSTLLEPIRSRCFQIRVPAIPVKNIAEILNKIVKKEKVKIPLDMQKHIVKNCDNSLRKAILILQTAYIQKALKPELLPVPEYIRYTKEIALAIFKNETTIITLRDKFYKLLMCTITVGEIITIMTNYYIEECDCTSDIILEILASAAENESNSHIGKYEIFYLEAFAAKLLYLFE